MKKGTFSAISVTIRDPMAIRGKELDALREYLAWRVLEGDVSEDDVYRYLDGSGRLVAEYPGLVPYFFYTLHASYWDGFIGVQYRNTCSRKHDDIMELFEKLAYEASYCRAVMLEAAGDRFIIKVNVYRGWQNKVTHKV